MTFPELSPQNLSMLSSFDGVTVVTPPAEVTYEIAEQLQQELCSAVDEHRVIIVDLSASEFCDSAGVGAITWAFKRARAAGGELRLVVKAELVRRIFKLTGIDRVIGYYESLPAAVTASSGHAPPGKETQPPLSPAAGE